MIDVTNISKAYSTVQALKDVSFHIPEGEVVGLLGPNGSGKTTLMKILTGYLLPDEGEATVDGLNVLENTLEAQSKIGYLPENAPLYPDLTVQSYLRMIAELRRVPRGEMDLRISDAVRATAITDRLTQTIGTLSKGYRQRVGLAQAILHKPKLLILDEPTIGLDPTQILEVRQLIRRLAEHSTILFSTHILSEVEANCNRVLILLRGELKADAALAELASTSDTVLELAKNAPDVIGDLRKLPGAIDVTSTQTNEGRIYRIRCRERVDLRPAVYELARQKDWPVRELRRVVRTLEAVFSELALGGAKQGEEIPPAQNAAQKQEVISRK